MPKLDRKTNVSLAAVLAVCLIASRVHAQETTFAIIGDYGFDNFLEEEVASLVKTWSPDFIITTGDNNYKAPGDAVTDFGEWDVAIGKHYGEFILGRSDNRYPNQTSATQRFFPVIGNHDTGTGPSNQGNSGGTSRPYLHYFHFDPGNPSGRLPVGTGRHEDFATYYDFRVGDIHFFMMDTEHAISDVELIEEQAAWLRSGLQKSTAEWKFVVTHFAPYTSAIKGNMPYAQLPYQQWGADGIFSGDNHVYERLSVSDELNQDMLYIVNGASGNSNLHPFPVSKQIEASQSRVAIDWGATRVTVGATEATFEYFTRDHVIQDSFSLNRDRPTFQRYGHSIEPDVDTFIDSNQPDGSFVDDELIRVGIARGDRQSLLHFEVPDELLDVFETTANAKAYLLLTPEVQSWPLSVHRVETDWRSDDITWNSAGGGMTPGVDFVAEPTDSSVQSTVAETIRLDVTADILAWAEASENFGWLLAADETDSTVIRSVEAFARSPQLSFVVESDGQVGDLLPTLVGDFDHSGNHDYGDIELLCGSLQANRPMMDLDNNGVVDSADLGEWMSLAGITPGNIDFELDGTVDSGDQLTLVQNWTGALGFGATWRHGDFDCDGDVDTLDRNQLVANWTGAGGVNAAVPEPSSLAIGLVALSFLVGSARRVFFDMRIQ